MNYFELFGLPNKFKLHNNILSIKFYKLQKKYHPDNFIHTNIRHQESTTEKSAKINSVYQILKNPISRMEHLLTVKNILLKTNITTHDPTCLMQQIELRETLGKIIKQKHAQHQLLHFKNKIQLLYRYHLTKMVYHFNKHSWMQVIQSIHYLKFIVKIQQKINSINTNV